jgi:hypothetical protein
MDVSFLVVLAVFIPVVIWLASRCDGNILVQLIIYALILFGIAVPLGFVARELAS